MKMQNVQTFKKCNASFVSSRLYIMTSNVRNVNIDKTISKFCKDFKAYFSNDSSYIWEDCVPTANVASMWL